MRNNKQCPAMVLVAAIAAIVLAGRESHAQKETSDYWLSTLLMESTYKLSGSKSFGTAFVMGKRGQNNPQRSFFVLVTAAHVLEDIKEDSAMLSVRKKLADGSWVRVDSKFLIRRIGKPLWTRHPDADIAAMYVPLPVDVHPTLDVSFLGTDKMFEDADIHPGEELHCLGFPLGVESNDTGFPVLRSGKVASYPLLPSRKTRTILFDFQVFPGNSGGPVFIMKRLRAGGGNLSFGNWQFIVGLVSKQRLLLTRTQDPFKITEEKHSFGLGEIVLSELIRETVDMLPDQP